MPASGTTRVLSLSIIIGVVIGVFLAIVAVITFTRVYDVSISSLDAVSHSLVLALANTAAIRLGTQVNASTAALEQLQYVVASDAHPTWRWTVPSDYDAAVSERGAAATWHDQWFEAISAAMQPMLGALGLLILRHADGSMISATRRPFDFPTYYYAARATTNATADTTFDVRTRAVLSNGTLVDPASPLAQDPFAIAANTFFGQRPGGPTWVGVDQKVAQPLNYGLDQLNSLNSTLGLRATSYAGTGLWFNGAGESGRAPAAAPPQARGIYVSTTFNYRYDAEGNIIPALLQSVSMPLFNASRMMIAVVTTTLPLLDLVQPILADIAAQHDGMAMFALDGSGYMLAATVGTFYAMLPLPTNLSTVPKFCSYLDAALGMMGCRAYAPDYDASPALGAAGLAFLTSPTPQAALVKASDGNRHYVASTPLRNSFVGFALHTVVAIPQTAITGEVARSTNTNIGIVAGCVVIAFVIAFALVWKLMGPLRMLARRMQMAAALEDNDAAAPLSLTKEVAGIEAAYYQMNQELQRLKGFVPQSVLVQNVHRRRILLIKEHLRETESEVSPWYTCWGCCRDAWAEAELEYDRVGTYSSESQEEEEHAAAAGGRVKTHKRNMSHFGASEASHDSRPSNTESMTSSAGGGGAHNRRHQTHARAPRDADGKPVPAPVGGVTGANGHGQQPAGVTTVRLVSVAALNVVGFHAAALRDGAVRLGNIAEALTALIAAAAMEERGVVDSFHGDHFLLTFNAAASCATHTIRAAKCALRIGQRAAATFAELGVRVAGGVASGPARCGTLGSKDARRFSIVGAAVPQAYALESLVRRHPRDALWRQPAAGPYRIAVAPTLLEELRTQLVYECVDIAPLPTTTAPPITTGVRSPAGAISTGLASSRAHRSAPPPAPLSAMGVVSQLLGEVAADAGGDEEWMYAVGDKETIGANDERGGPRIQRRLGATDSAAIRDARALLRAQGADSPIGHAAAARRAAQCRDDELELAASLSASHDGASTTPLTTGRTTGTGMGTDRTGDGSLPLVDANAVFMLLGDVARMRERGVAIPLALQQQLAAAHQQQLMSSNYGDTSPLGRSRGSYDASGAQVVVDDFAGKKAGLGGGTNSAPPLTSPLEEKVAEVEAALRRWEAQCPNATANIAAVRHLLLVVLGI
jgi:class 3 adenylate cyclase